MTPCVYHRNDNCEDDGICKKSKSLADGLSLRCVGEWSKHKMEHFKYYAEMFSTGMKYKWPIRYYIDLFSGPGRCIIRETREEVPGSPINALSVPDKFTKCFFVGINRLCTDELEKRIVALKLNNYEIINEDCNIAIDQIIKNVSKKSLSLIIVDPTSLQFKFSSYKKLSQLNGDIIINYPFNAVERSVTSIGKDSQSQKLDEFHPGWREIFGKQGWGNSQKQNLNNLVDDYIKKICDLGYISEKLDAVDFKNSKNASLYYLIAFSKNPKGLVFWQKAKGGLQKRKRQQTLI